MDFIVEFDVPKDLFVKKKILKHFIILCYEKKKRKKKPSQYQQYPKINPTSYFSKQSWIAFNEPKSAFKTKKVGLKGKKKTCLVKKNIYIFKGTKIKSGFILTFEMI